MRARFASLLLAALAVSCAIDKQTTVNLSGYDELCAQARSHILKGDDPQRAIEYCNTAILEDPSRVDAYHYRAIAIGRRAEQNSAYGIDAMNEIEVDCRRAIEIDETFDHGGPHRVLGALYLKAPGPPTGIGSPRRALRHLERARAIAPANADNLIWLSRVYVELGRSEESIVLLARALRDLGDEMSAEERERCTRRLEKLKNDR